MKKRILLILVAIVSLFMVYGCSFFEEDSEGVKDIVFSENENGDLIASITYFGSDEAVEHIIPKGLDGKDGVSVSIEYKREKESYRTKVTMTLSDGTQQVFYVPDGVRIVDVETTEFEGEKAIILHYSDDSQSDAIALPRGEKGNGIDPEKSKFEQQEDGSINVSLYYTDSETPVEFTIPTGKTGNGIEQITPIEENGAFALEIVYTSGDIKTVSFTRPVFWYQGYGAPTLAQNSETVQNAVSGDYYFDYFESKIYQYMGNNFWNIVVDFAQNENVFTVNFIPNADDVNPYETQRSNVKYGSTLVGIPQPTRSGYIFKGWSTSPVETAVSGRFTELTPVFSNLDLYAIWEKIE